MTDTTSADLADDSPERIFLSPDCPHHSGDSRTWSSLSDGNCEHCAATETEYIRADLVSPQPAGDVAGLVERLATRVVQDVCELPDRTSPHDWPEAMLVTDNELQALIEQACEAIGVAPALEPGVAEIAVERRRQREVEGWTEAHDDQHWDGALARAAACYAVPDAVTWPQERDGRLMYRVHRDISMLTWPWSREWWKPKNRLRDLERAGALIAAEIARIKRRQPAPPAPTQSEAT